MTGPLLGAVVVASNRAAAGVYEDATGPLLVEFLTRLGFETGAPAVGGGRGPRGPPHPGAGGAGAPGRRPPRGPPRGPPRPPPAGAPPGRARGVSPR